ncbi:Uncharacterised protein [Vibrio cholerae]|nr:Uncharacterised protein [Vibrio cholerae]
MCKFTNTKLIFCTIGEILHRVFRNNQLTDQIHQ